MINQTENFSPYDKTAEQSYFVALQVTKRNRIMPEQKVVKLVTTHVLYEMKLRGEKIAMLTAYDYSMARILDEAGIDIILVGTQPQMSWQVLTLPCPSPLTT